MKLKSALVQPPIGDTLPVAIATALESIPSTEVAIGPETNGKAHLPVIPLTPLHPSADDPSPVNEQLDSFLVRRLLSTLISIRKGDFSARFVLDESIAPTTSLTYRLAEELNDVIEMNQNLVRELERTSTVVGKEGKITQRAALPNAAGAWAVAIEAVNSLISDLAQPLTEVARVIGGVAKGDLSQTMAMEIDERPLKGEFLRTGKVVNTMVEQLSSFASEVTRVAREVGTEGKLGGQAQVKGVSGTWNDLTDNVNFMAANLTTQVRNIAQITTAVANGDLSKKITADVKGEFLELKNTVNTMVDQLNSFTSEVTRVAREVGTEGKLGGQATAKGAAGAWKDLTDNVNFMAANLTTQVRNIAQITTAVANGDLSKKITADVNGEFLELKNTVNTMVDQLNSFTSEVTRVAREVGTEGKLGGQAMAKGAAGAWKDLTDNVNFMAANLTTQVRNIAQITTAVANGDLSKKITADVNGEFLELKSTVNTMVDQLNSFTSEVTRVAREVGTEGKLGGQAMAKGAAGAWKDLTDNVNFMAANLTTQLRNIAQITTAVANGDLSKKITADVKGEFLELKNTINTMVDQLNSFASEVTRVAREVGTEGKLGGQATAKGAAGAWKDLTDSVNFMAANLTTQVRNIAQITTAVANGDLSKKITADVSGEFLELKNTVNTMVDQLNSFTSEVTRVAREVGTEGKLGGQAMAKGAAGAWKDLTDNVNFMATNLTTQLRNIAQITTAVANGDLSKKITADVEGEFLELKNTINTMVDQLNGFASEVTRVAREVGTEGKLGGQAEVPGASGTWRDLTDTVNRLAANLTTQVRAMAEVATAVTKGDLSRTITVEAAGEVAYLKDNVNEMIRNLKDTTRKNMEQDWLKTNLARFTRLLQGQKDLWTVSRLILSELAPLVNMQHGVFYVSDTTGPEPVLTMLASYAYRKRKDLSNQFKFGEGIVGQCALEKQQIIISNVPSDYIKVNSGLGESAPVNIVVLPVLFEGQIKAVIELASFHEFNDIHLAFLDQLTESIGIVLNTIEANMRTESLLAQSQSLTQELQTQQQELTETNRRLEQQADSLQTSEDQLKQQQEELQQTNDELQDKARLLGEQKSEVERKNQEIESARRAIEEKAEQLALTSKYKSEFLANMSHELRTPLNSMLILSKMLADNYDLNLTQKQTEFATTIHSSGADLLALINEILDLSKIEAGAMSVDVGEVQLWEIEEDMHRTFDALASEKGLTFEVNRSEGVCEYITTDSKRLQQVLRNLLSNAFKFTHQGRVFLQMFQASKEMVFDNESLKSASKVIGFAVKDTGIGIPLDKQNVIFEAFQQADGTTSREYGGTGLGLSISREIARLLGGEIRLTSSPGQGSTFTLYLPETYVSATAPDIVKPGIAFRESSNSSPWMGNQKRTPISLPTAVERGNVPGLSQESSPESPLVARRSLGARASRTLQSYYNNVVPSDIDEIPDDRDLIQAGDLVLLVIEDDPRFAQILVDMGREKGFKVIAANRGETGLAYARRYKPDAITLDIQLPGIHGLVVLDWLKHDPLTRHIPVNIVSVLDELPRQKRSGAVRHIQKPVSADEMNRSLEQMRNFAERPKTGQNRRLLIVEDNAEARMNIEQLMDGDGDVEMTAVGTGAEAIEKLNTEKFDCAIVDFGLPDMSGLDLIQTIRKDLGQDDLPIIVYTARDLTTRESAQLNTVAEAVILKDVTSIDKLLDETSMFLHRVETNLPEDKRKRLQTIHSTQVSLADKKVLIVDDDIRNIFAINSFLERFEMCTIYAENGREALDMIAATPDIDIVLMDIMMPGMDGYETMQQIRSNPQFRKMPIIAVTAKALRGDREKCIEAGASDYITKPVDVDQLLSLLRVWLFKE